MICPSHLIDFDFYMTENLRMHEYNTDFSPETRTIDFTFLPLRPDLFFVLKLHGGTF